MNLDSSIATALEGCDDTQEGASPSGIPHCSLNDCSPKRVDAWDVLVKGGMGSFKAPLDRASGDPRGGLNNAFELSGLGVRVTG